MRPKLSLRARIFTALISLVVIASFLIALVTIYQYREQSNQYHELRLERKEAQLQTRIEYILSQSPFPNSEQFLDSIFGEVVFQIADEQNVNFKIFNTDGKLITNTQLPTNDEDVSISSGTLVLLHQNPSKNFVEISADGQNRSAYSFIKNETGEAIGILNLSYVDDDSSVRWSYKTFSLACCKCTYSSLVLRLYSPMWCRALSPNHWKRSAIKSPKQPWTNPTKNRFEPPR